MDELKRKEQAMRISNAIARGWIFVGLVLVLAAVVWCKP